MSFTQIRKKDLTYTLLGTGNHFYYRYYHDQLRHQDIHILHISPTRGQIQANWATKAGPKTRLLIPITSMYVTLIYTYHTNQPFFRYIYHTCMVIMGYKKIESSLNMLNLWTCIEMHCYQLFILNNCFCTCFAASKYGRTTWPTSSITVPHPWKIRERIPKKGTDQRIVTHPIFRHFPEFLDLNLFPGILVFLLTQPKRTMKNQVSLSLNFIFLWNTWNPNVWPQFLKGFHPQRPKKQGPTLQFFNQNKGGPFGVPGVSSLKVGHWPIHPPLGNGRRNTRDTMAAVSNATAATFWDGSGRGNPRRGSSHWIFFCRSSLEGSIWTWHGLRTYGIDVFNVIYMYEYVKKNVRI